MSPATRLGIAGMRICALVDPQYADTIVALVEELVDAAGTAAVKQYTRAAAALAASSPHYDAAKKASQSAEQGAAGRDSQPPASPPTSDAKPKEEPEVSPLEGAPASTVATPEPPTLRGGEGTPAGGTDSAEQASQASTASHSPQPAEESPGAALSRHSDGSAAAIKPSAETPQAQADAPRGTSTEEPAPQRHPDTVRGLAEIPADERARIYDRWITSRKANHGKVPATSLEDIAMEFNTTAKVVYNFCYHRFNNPPKGTSARPVPVPRVSSSTDANAETVSRQKALAALAPPAPRSERFKVRRMQGTYGGGE